MKTGHHDCRHPSTIWFIAVYVKLSAPCSSLACRGRVCPWPMYLTTHKEAVAVTPDLLSAFTIQN